MRSEVPVKLTYIFGLPLVRSSCIKPLQYHLFKSDYEKMQFCVVESGSQLLSFFIQLLRNFGNFANTTKTHTQKMAIRLAKTISSLD